MIRKANKSLHLTAIPLTCLSADRCSIAAGELNLLAQTQVKNEIKFLFMVSFS